MLTLSKTALAVTAIALWSLGSPRTAGTAAAAWPPPVATPGGMQTATIHDPGMDLDAVTVPYPAKWHFQGTILQGTACSSIPLPVFRVFSPDGLSEIERMPRIDWRWSAGGPPGPPASGCAPFKQVMTAKEILQYTSAILKVEYVRDLPVAPEKVAAYTQALAPRAPGPGSFGMKRFPDEGDLASAVVRYKNGSFTMEGRLDAQVRCQHTQMGPPTRIWDIHVCWANLKYAHAPEAQFSTVSALADNVTEVIVPQWLSTYLTEQARQGQAMIKKGFDDNNARMGAQRDQFERGQAMRQRQNDEFNSTLARGTQMSMNQATQIANSNHTITSDWTDYSLDRQTVRDPNTGQVSKVSSTYNYTWLDESGKTAFQTTDANADPNGSLKGNWTRQQVVHGDGSD
ncbi:MAG TPA: hypothetical protein VGI83_03560 [Gemmatimonadales bacterium]